MSVVAVIPKPAHRFEGIRFLLAFNASFEVLARYCFEPGKIAIYNLLLCTTFFTPDTISYGNG